MKKGYIFKDNGIWVWATLEKLTPQLDALCEIQGEFDSWDEALQDMIAAQIQEA